jgi:serine-type D-Ala-D-Ala carboxypeptidase (penicillin-binding protein 5/6)
LSMKRVYTNDYASKGSLRPRRRTSAARGRPSRPQRERPAPKAEVAQARGPSQGEPRRTDRKRRTTKPRKIRIAFTAVILLVLFIFFVSCLLTLADANSGPTFAETVRELKAPAGKKADAPGVWANAAALLDAESGRLLYEKNGHVKLPIASTTKMMTALVVRDSTKLKDKVVVPPAATQVGEEGIDLVPNETLTVEQLLNVMLIQSANDAAYALAIHTGGSIEGFAAMMNKKATQLGAVDSHFTNPHGLDQAGHYSTAYDLALIGRAVMQDPVLAKIVVTPKYSIPMPGQAWSRVAVGHNEILSKYAGADGVKTGYTAKAGQCLVASAKKDGKALVAVSLNSTHRADDVAALFNYGFNNTARMVFVKKDQNLGRSRVSAFPRRFVTVVPQNEMAALTFVGSGDVFKVVTAVQRNAQSSVKVGQPLGKIDVLLNNSQFEKADAVSSQTRSSSNILGAIGAFVWYSLCWTGKIFSAPFRIF